MPPVKGILKTGRRRSPKTVKMGVKFDNKVEEGFTKEEKAQIIARNQQIVAELNKYLPDDQKIQPDPNFEKKLDDPQVAKMYRLGQKIKQRDDRQRQIWDELRNKYGSTRVNFTAMGSLRIGNTPEDRAYNETLYRNFKEDPDKFIYKQYHKMMQTSGKELYDLGDDPIKQGQYYLDNYEKVSYASNIKSVVNSENNKGIFTDEFKGNIKSVASLGHMMYQTKYALNDVNSLDKIAFPTLNKTQIDKLYDSRFSSDHYNDMADVSSKVRDLKYGWGKEPSPKQMMDTIKEKTGVDLSNEAHLMTGKIFYDKEGIPMDVEDIVKGKNNFSSAKEISDPTQKRSFRGITNDFKLAYMKNWKTAFNDKMGVKGSKIDIEAIENKQKGNILQRMFRRPSKEYTAMMDAFKAYNDPKSKDFMNKDKLSTATQAYVDHKNEKGSVKSRADKDRMEFAENVFATCNESDKIYRQTENSFADQSMQRRVTFLLPKDVNVEIVTKEKESVVIKVNEGPSQDKAKEQEPEL